MKTTILLLLAASALHAQNLTIPNFPLAKTIAEAWAGVDPRVEPLDIEVLKTWTEDNANYTEFYFTGFSYEGEKVRVYSIYAAPVGGKNLPAVLHIHGGGQTANVQWLKYWTSRGYAALTYDFCGKWQERKKYTLWGKLDQGNMASQLKDHVTEPSVRLSRWYLWTVLGRRALTVLEREPEVDPSRMGIFGISVGGSLVWSVAGTDDRVKATVAIYGLGWNTYPDRIDDPDPNANDAQVQLWRKLMEPEVYAPLIRTPVLLLDATNDFHGKMDWGYKTLDSLLPQHRQAFTPQYNHHIGAAQENDLPMWMDTWLNHGKAWPKAPEVRITLGHGGVPQLTLKPDASQHVKHVDLYYAVGDRGPKDRFWRTAEGRARGKNWLAPLRVLDVNQPLLAFANVFYESGICLSSNLARVIPAKLGAAKATDKPALLIDDFSEGIRDWASATPGTDPIPPVKETLMLGTGPEGKPGVTVSTSMAIQTHKIADPKWRGPDGARLDFQVYAQSQRELHVTVHEHWFTVPGPSKQFIAIVSLHPGAGWQTVTLSAQDFKTDKGEVLPNWQDADGLALDAGEGSGAAPLYTNFIWRMP